MKKVDLDWMLNQARLSELLIFRNWFYDLIMAGANRDDLVDQTFARFRERVAEIEGKL